MPKHNLTPTWRRTPATIPYPAPVGAASRNAAIWSNNDDEILLRARASGLNWQPIAIRHFPNKTANACRKRHERLLERRNMEDWDSRKLGLLAEGYLAMRKEMWERLANQLGERWTVVETKCMEKGVKGLQAVVRTAQRKSPTSSGESFDEQGTRDHHSDSGIGMGSDAEMEVGDEIRPAQDAAPLHTQGGVQHRMHSDHTRSRSLPQPLPLYQPPPPITTTRLTSNRQVVTSPETLDLDRPAVYIRNSPDSQNGRGSISIQSVLSPLEPPQAS